MDRILADFRPSMHDVTGTTSSLSPESAFSPAAPRGEPGPATAPSPAPREIGGPPGPEPTRYGDWEAKGRCIDF